MTELRKMTEREYEIWHARSKAQYMQAMQRAFDLTEAEAKARAEKSFSSLLRDGAASKEHYFFTLYHDGKIAGYLWYGTQIEGAKRRAYIYDVVIEEDRRGQGLGRKAMQLAEEEARRLGHNEMGLHVFAFNRNAIGLYESLGYITTDMWMTKKIEGRA